jgi:uncharacterized membrane protein
MMEMNDIISYGLRIGVIISFLLLALGSVLLFINGGGGGYTIKQLSMTNSSINSSQFSINGIMHGIGMLDGMDIIMLGLIVLVATPIVRVLLSIVAFVVERNPLYTIITIIVLTDLMIAIFIIPKLIIH